MYLFILPEKAAPPPDQNYNTVLSLDTNSMKISIFILYNFRTMT